MNLQELSNIWNSTDNEQEKNIHINKTLFKEVSMNKIQSSLKEIKWTSFIEIAVNIPFLFFLWNFIVQHYATWKFLIPALALLFFTFYSLGFIGYKLFLFYSIDAKASVLQTQKNIAKLKYCEQMEVHSLYVIIPLFYVVFLIVFAKALANFDLYQLGNWLILQGIGGFVVSLIVVFFLKKFPNKHLQESIDFLEEIKEMN